jgi:hypothetical protein
MPSKAQIDIIVSNGSVVVDVIIVAVLMNQTRATIVIVCSGCSEA